MTIQPFSFRYDTCACTEWKTLLWFLVLVNSPNAFCWLCCDLKWNEMMNSVLKWFVLFFLVEINENIFIYLQKPVRVDQRLDLGHQHQHQGQISRFQRTNAHPPTRHTTASTKQDVLLLKLVIRCFTTASKLNQTNWFMSFSFVDFWIAKNIYSIFFVFFLSLDVPKVTWVHVVNTKI